MEAFRVLITDLTDFGQLHCVAGWDLDKRVMIRPEPGPAQFWEKRFCGANHVFSPGNVVSFNADIPNPKTELPHLNEDRVVQGEPQIQERLSERDFKVALRSIKAFNRDTAFAAPTKVANNKPYVEVGTNQPSLKALVVNKQHIRFTSDTFRDQPAKPRCIVSLSNGNSINLSIAATDLRQQFRNGGVKALVESFSGADDLAIRLGCARGFGDFPTRCYMQINGIFSI